MDEKPEKKKNYACVWVMPETKEQLFQRRREISAAVGYDVLNDEFMEFLFKLADKFPKSMLGEFYRKEMKLIKIKRVE